MSIRNFFQQLFAALLLAFLVVFLPAIILETSRFRTYRPLSVREKDLAQLRGHVWDGGSYVVITGITGVGKSCLIESFISEMGGVVECHVSFSQ